MKFEATLEKSATMDATSIRIPFDVEKTFGARRVPVRVSINDAEYRTTIFRMKGTYFVVVPKAFRAAAGVEAGETITVTMEKDTAERTVEIPPDLAAALANAGRAEAFAKLSYTHRKEHVNAINDAKKAETRARRIEKTLEMLEEKRK